MFAVFAEDFSGFEFFSRGLSPQMAWENMLTDFAIEEEDIDVDTVRFFVETDIVRETKITWQIPDTDDE
jgi:hypothetical protein